MGGKRSRDKGLRRERETVERFRSLPGWTAFRVPLSGASEGFKGDLLIHGPGIDLGAEVKARANGEGWKKVKEWLGDHDLLILVEDRQEPLVVVPWAVFERLVSEEVQCSTNYLGAENHSPAPS